MYAEPRACHPKRRRRNEKESCLCIVLLFLAVSLLFSKGANEKAYDSFWSVLSEYYPMYYIAQSEGLDLESIRDNGKTKFNEETSEYEMLFLLRRLCYNFVNLDYIAVTFPATDDASGTEIPALERKSPSTTYIPSLKTVILRIPSFEVTDLTQDRISRSLEGLGDVENIIFDITGNRTGNNNEDLSVVLALFGGSWDYSYRAYFRNRYIAGLFFNAEVIKQTENQLYRDEYRLPCYVDVTKSYEFGDGTLNDRLRNAKRWILVDSETSYTADFFASFAQAAGWATVVGHRTKGNGTGLPILRSLLDGKKYELYFNATVIDNNKGGLKILSGTIPDIMADDGRSALKLCLDLIESRL